MNIRTTKNAKGTHAQLHWNHRTCLCSHQPHLHSRGIGEKKIAIRRGPQGIKEARSLCPNSRPTPRWPLWGHFVRPPCPKKVGKNTSKKKKPPQFLSSIWAPKSSDLSRDYADYPLFWLAPNLDKVQGLNMPRAPSRLSQTQLVIPSWSHFRTLAAQSLERRKKYMTPTYRHRHRRRKRLHGFDKLERERVYLQEQQWRRT